MKIKVLSLLQPWASLVVIGEKKIETRAMNTNQRGTILIHASASKRYKKIMDEDPLFGFYHQLFAHGKIDAIDDLPFGAIIGRVDLVRTELIQTLFGQTVVQPEGLTQKERFYGDYRDGRYAWHLANPVAFKHHTPFRGGVGFTKEFTERICMMCGCTDQDCSACIAETGEPCHWVHEYLCSACADKNK